MAKPKTAVTSGTAQAMLAHLASVELNNEAKVDLMVEWASSGSSDIQKGFRQVIGKLITEGTADDRVAAMEAELRNLISEIQAGPQKEGTFLGIVPGVVGANARALVEVDNGDRGYVAVLDKDMTNNLKVGDTIMVSMKAGTITGMGVAGNVVGDEVSFTRRIDADRVEIKTRGDDKRVVRLAHELREQVLDNKVVPGSTLVMNRAGTMAREAILPQTGFEHYKFLETVSPPNVVVERDIGAPPRCIDEISRILRLEMTQPEVRRKYRMRRCITKLLAGVSGAGKTLAIHAIWRRMYEIMSDVTGLPIDKLPPRVFWLRPSKMLSKWFGESERLIDQAMDEVQALADEKIIAADGTALTMPVMVVMEEIDGIARSRGDGDQIYSRILTTLLQRLDPTQPALQQRLILFIGTTNEPGQVDRAFLRRIGGSVEQFGNLDRKGFMMVLDKHLRDLPLCGSGTPVALRKRFGEKLASWLFDVESDHGLVSITIGGKEARCNRCDFLTGGLIDRAVQQAASLSSDKEADGNGNGIVIADLAAAFDEQLHNIADQITAENLGKFTPLPDGQRVTKVVRIPAQPLPELSV